MRLVNPTVAVTVNGRRIACEVAASGQAQARGLQGVWLLPGTGMLFPWADENVRSFHMGRVAYPIQVGFYRQNGRCVRAATGYPGTRDQWTGLASYVLETRTGVQTRESRLIVPEGVRRFVRTAVERPYLTDEYWPMPQNNLFGEDVQEGEDGTPGESKEPGGTWADAHDPVKRHPSATDLGPGEFTQFNSEHPLFGDSVSDSVSEDWWQQRRGSAFGCGSSAWGLSRALGRRASLDSQDLVSIGEQLGEWVASTRSGVDWRKVEPKTWQSPKYRRIVEALGYDQPFEVGILTLDLLPASLRSAARGSPEDFHIAGEALLTSEGIRSFAAKLLEKGVADIVKSDDSARELILIREIKEDNRL